MMICFFVCYFSEEHNNVFINKNSLCIKIRRPFKLNTSVHDAM